jgi:hypothetical protein
MNAITAYGLCSGAGEGIRTLDPNLGKVRHDLRRPSIRFAALRKNAIKQ